MENHPIILEEIDLLIENAFIAKAGGALRSGLIRGVNAVKRVPYVGGAIRKGFVGGHRLVRQATPHVRNAMSSTNKFMSNHPVLKQAAIGAGVATGAATAIGAGGAYAASNPLGAASMATHPITGAVIGKKVAATGLAIRGATMLSGMKKTQQQGY